ncbi:MAG: peptidylprolyl isomerase, partial [Bacteroidetes bacterium]|nr:peptidylprolyl isomerase [Bacteroidota bacterium]
MKKATVLTVISLLILSGNLHSQENEKVLMTINDQPVTIAEFERIFKKNNTKDSQVDRKSLEEYLELFINFKLKVMEAEAQQLDTAESFIRELAGYRKQLTKPYLTDQEVEENLIKEAYERLNYDVHAKHILVKLAPDASPEDTIKAYKRIMEIRDRIVKKNEPFEKVANEVSEDDYCKQNQNGGDLGYFTAFRMVYPFETAAYKTEPGQVSPPFRTNFGYHIIKVQDKRKSPGQVRVAHIMVAVPQGITPAEEEKKKARIFEVNNKLKEGGDFHALALEYSDDKGTAKRGGELNWFGTGQMLPEFENTAFLLNSPGDISEPVRTSVGWHIIKLIEKKPMGSF